MEPSCVVIIPIYKPIPNETEKVSFVNNIKTLANHKIAIVTFKELDLSFYIDILSSEKVNYQLDFFEKKYFESLLSYNKLLLSRDFYQHYQKFRFMLITQLDVYVFRDELDYWCKKDFDYIGAPWFSFFRKDHLSGKLEKVGNGGFSLRKTQSYLQAIDYAENHNKIISINNFINRFDLLECGNFTLKNVLKKLIGINNTFRYYIRSATNEDVVWSQVVPEVLKNFRVATVEDAIKFSFETDPAYLYELNNNQLPFGCHAWEKYQYDKFWKFFIKV